MKRTPRYCAPMIDLTKASDGTPAHIHELAVACVQYVERATGVLLDFTGDTLPLLDHYLRSAEAIDPAVRALLAPAAGAYFGEVVRQAYPARWTAPESEPEAWRIEFERCFLYFNPVAFAIEVMESRDAVEGGAGFGVTTDDLPMLQSALASLGAIPEDEYRSFSTRFDVLEGVVDRLMAGSEKEFPGLVQVSADVYRAALDPPGGRAN